MERQSIYNVMVRDNGYRQLIDNPTTDNNTLIDHIYIYIYIPTLNKMWKLFVSGYLETKFSDHKAIYGCHAKKDIKVYMK